MPSVLQASNPGEIARHGADILSRAGLTFPVYIGTMADARISALASTGALPLPQTTEAYAFAPDGNGYVLAGYDEKGLLYGCQELAERAANGTPPAAFEGKPYTKIRGIYAFLHNQELEDEWFFSETYWIDYFDGLAANRYNSFNLVFSHQTAYLAPMFAYFLPMPEYPDLRLPDADGHRILKNYNMLQFISKQAEKRGIDFLVGIWQVTPWKNQQCKRPEGLTDETLPAFTYTAMKRLIAEFPAVKGIQIRANEESGIERKNQVEFFTNTLFKAMAEADRPFIFDFRCWMAEPQAVENALSMVPGTRLSCKYWGEFMGGPYQPAKIVPGYSYSDCLKQPLTVDFVYQLWNLGSPRLLLWGDAAYAKRFVESLKLGGGAGFEMNMHLAQKGYGNEPGYWRIFKHKEDEYYTHEYERYWLMNRLFGRLSYDPDCRAEAWTDELSRRFGSAAGGVNALYTAGSGIITYLARYQLSDLNMYIWPEIDTGGLLDFYIQTPTSDVCTVDTIEGYVDSLLLDEPSGLLTPLEAAARLREMAEATLRAAQGLEACANPSKEMVSTIRDFKILAFLALYHNAKTLAAVDLQLYYKTGDRTQLRGCREGIRKALICWEQLVSQTKDYYHGNMVTGPNDAGSWQTKLTLAYEDVLRVEELLRIAERYGGAAAAFDFGASKKDWSFGVWVHFACQESYMTERGFRQVGADAAYSPESGFGWESGAPADVEMPLVRLNDLQFDPWYRDSGWKRPVEKCKGFRNALTEDGVCGSGPAVFRCDLPNGEYEVTVLIADQTPDARMRGPMSVTVQGEAQPALMAMPLEERELVARASITDGKLLIGFSGTDWFVSGIVVKALAPVIQAAPCGELRPEDAVMTVVVTAPGGVESVSVTIDGGGTYPMRRVREGEYSAALTDALPFGAAVRVGCVVRAVAYDGRCAEKALILRLRNKESHFAVTHTPVASCKPGECVVLTAFVDAAYPLRKAVLHYSHVNQYEDMRTVEMTPVNGVYQAEIPAGYVEPQWDLLYYFSFVDEAGGGVIVPNAEERTPYWVIVPER